MGRNNLASAVWTTVAAIVCGCALFQATSLSFDYMKLRQLPIYASATSISEFSGTVDIINGEMRERRALIRRLFQDRSTSNVDIFQAEQKLRQSVVDARAFLRAELTKQQLEAVGFARTQVTFNDVDPIFQQYCSPEDNSVATTVIENASGAPVTTPASETKNKTIPKLTPTQETRFKTACAIPDGFCVEDKPSSTAGKRARMICAQTMVQSVKDRAKILDSFTYDGAQQLTDSLKPSYPEVALANIIRTAQIVETYRALTMQRGGSECIETTNANVDRCAKVERKRNWLAPFWDFLFSQPLAVMYMILALLFGGLGNLSSYLFATVAPERIAATPEEGPWYAALAGGGSAILVLLVVMAGFQFLAVGGASTPDLAYPNPLTVCGLAVLVGLRGEAVLTTLKEWVTKFLGGEATQNSATPPDAPPAPDPLDADHTEKT